MALGLMLLLLIGDSLKFLSLRNSTIESLPVNLNLDTLTLNRCRVKTFSSQTGKLRILNLHFCLCVGDVLVSLKDFHNLHSLKIQGYDNMESLPNAITELYNLKDLHLLEFKNLKKLPDNMGQLVNLDRLTLRKCGIMCIPTGLCNLKSLLIWNCPIDFQVMNELVSLTYLSISHCRVKSLKGFTAGLSSLIKLRIMFCDALEELSIELNTLVSLQTLSITFCVNFKLPPSIGALHKLDELNLCGCRTLNKLPADFDRLTNLSLLQLEYTNIQSLPSTITKLPRLEYLYLPLCFKLETLPVDLNFSSISVFIPPHYRLDTLPTKFSAILEEKQCHRLHLKATVDSAPDYLRSISQLTDLLFGTCFYPN